MIKQIVLAVFFLSSLEAYNPGWREFIKETLRSPLKTPPIVTKITSGNEYVISVKNVSRETLFYLGAARHRPRLFRETWRDGWQDRDAVYCVIGMEPRPLAPGASVDFTLRTTPNTRERYYTIFSDRENKRSSLVLLLETKRP